MLPNKIFYVEVLPGGEPLGFRQRGGKIFTRHEHAENHKETLERQGVFARVMVLESPVWREV